MIYYKSWGKSDYVTYEFEVAGTAYQGERSIPLSEAEEECAVETAQSEVLDPQKIWHVFYSADDQQTILSTPKESATNKDNRHENEVRVGMPLSEATTITDGRTPLLPPPLRSPRASLGAGEVRRPIE
ncbi:MAG: hypothetical protein AVDCRST_MAG93-8856 [uncultured Chloroflexia bacterium]|uniref:Uncharacterized protein n=1 Tax=uncultured Chloroflexia bacterium TaxID=1672391 RepID=A0A6J4N7L1_9CHLR|nr:MAG: hypothetical protein AVDCRST_MAG93-8856 [uncultured Chloroflexia bacterium]